MHISIKLTDNARKYIIDSSYSEAYGARPMKRFVSKNIETLLANNIIEDNLKFGEEIIIDIENNKFVIKN